MSNPPTDLYQRLLEEVILVRKYVKDRSDEEILAYLEAHVGDSNRVETVVRELRDGDENLVFPAKEECSGTEDKICLIDLTEDDDQCFLQVKSLEDPQPSTSTSAAGAESPVEKQVETLMEMFPDGDPEFFSGFIQENYANSDVVQETVNMWLENKSYKKLEQAKKDSIKRKFAERNFTVEEFLEMFPDPEKYFNNPDRVVAANYKKHIYVYALNNFPNIPQPTVAKMLVKHKYHLIPFVRQAKCFEPRIGVELNPIPDQIEMPQPMDELFYKELQYLELADEIKEYQNKKKDEKKKKIEEARCAGTLMTCECCFEDELLLEDLLPCTNDHLFCKDCIRRQAEINIGANNLHFPCFNGYCKEHFPMRVLQSCLKPNIFSIVLRKVQEEEIRRAEIPDLEACPFCSFCAIMPDTNDKVFKCLNPECLKESCRLCKEPNHVPLRCNEIENKTEVDMRTFIENKMTDALLRTCPSCKRRFIKDYGCNKMTCTCGQLMCYVCRQPIADYEHFEKTINLNSGKCQLYCNDLEMNSKELQKTATSAREEYIKKHPESANIELKYDPTKNISSERRVDFNYEEMMFNLHRRQREMEERLLVYAEMSSGERSVQKLARMCEALDRPLGVVMRAPHMMRLPYMPDLAVPIHRRHEILIPGINPFLHQVRRIVAPPLPAAFLPEPPHLDNITVAKRQIATARTLAARKRPRPDIAPATTPNVADPLQHNIVATATTNVNLTRPRDVQAPNYRSVFLTNRTLIDGTPTPSVAVRRIAIPEPTGLFWSANNAPNAGVTTITTTTTTTVSRSVQLNPDGSLQRIAAVAPRKTSVTRITPARPARIVRPATLVVGGAAADVVGRETGPGPGSLPVPYFGCGGSRSAVTGRESLLFGSRKVSEGTGAEKPECVPLGNEAGAVQKTLSLADESLRLYKNIVRNRYLVNPNQMFPCTRFSGKLVGGKELQSAQRQTTTAAAEQPLDETNIGYFQDDTAVPTSTDGHLSELKDVELDKPPEAFVKLQKQMLRFWAKKQSPPATASPNSSLDLSSTDSMSDVDD